jgi:hypothetical protein
VRLISLNLVVPALTLASRSVRDAVENNVDGGAKAVHVDVHDVVPSVPHVRRHDTAEDLTVFITEFEAPLSKLGA